ncbi:ISAs1 family transposase [Moraxella bovis]|uniref:ISAs1 family transposase n=1 Tax=Moraxella bovis TaxID=476 RepID=UPI000E1C0794|nr:ISAs1 family transposase [Moraxella bovis]
MEDFGSENKTWFATFFDLTHGIPSHDTFGNVFKRLNKDELSRYFSEWINQTQANHPHIAIDGKFIQGGYKNDNALQLVTAFASQTKLILAQVDIADKNNEISTLPQLLKLIDISGSIVTADAIYCQKDISKQIIKAKANYIFALKQNHKTLYEDIVLWLNSKLNNNNITSIQTVEKDHGRIETRRYATSTQLDWLSGKDDWTNLHAVVMVESIRDVKDKVTTEHRYYLSSLTDVNMIADAIRNHWSIENSQHWVLDVIFSEDDQKSLERNEKTNKALPTRTALNLIRVNGDAKLSVKRSKMRASRNKSYLEQLLFGKG